MPNPVDIEVPYHFKQAIEAASGLSAVEVFLGWVPNEGFSTPSVSIMTGEVTRRDDRQLIDLEGVDTDTVAAIFRDAFVTIRLTLELYTTSKTARKDLAEPLRKVFHEEPVSLTDGKPTTGLMATLDGHHDAPARYFLRDSSPSDEEAAGQGYFRQTFEVQVESEERDRHEYDKATFTTNVQTTR